MLIVIVTRCRAYWTREQRMWNDFVLNPGSNDSILIRAVHLVLLQFISRYFSRRVNGLCKRKTCKLSINRHLNALVFDHLVYLNVFKPFLRTKHY